MKRVAIIAVLVGLSALSAHGESIPLTINIMHAMTPIDSVPTKQDIEDIFPQNAAIRLAEIAQDAYADFGVRLRAIRALPQFCLPSCMNTAPHNSLLALLDSVPPADQAGTSILLLRATMESRRARTTRSSPIWPRSSAIRAGTSARRRPSRYAISAIRRPSRPSATDTTSR
jgi:hypothetical protein